jgi:hypothetical protein
LTWIPSRPESEHFGPSSEKVARAGVAGDATTAVVAAMAMTNAVTPNRRVIPIRLPPHYLFNEDSIIPDREDPCQCR